MEIANNPKNNAAKFAFFYFLSLVALIFMALPAGMIIFQIINKHVIDPLAAYNNDFSLSTLQFALSAVLIATPVYYFITRQINRALEKGELNKDSGLRKWLTYFILFVASVIVIGCLIGVVNSFLNGELSGKVALKMATAILIPIFIFSFYFYDIRREIIIGAKDKLVKIYFWASLALVAAIFISALFSVDSPAVMRDRRADDKVSSNLSAIQSAINDYYLQNKKLPADLATVQHSLDVQGKTSESIIKDSITGQAFDYQITGSTTPAYKLCAQFRLSNLDNNNNNYISAPSGNFHAAGWQCFQYTVDSPFAPAVKPIN